MGGDGGVKEVRGEPKGPTRPCFHFDDIFFKIYFTSYKDQT